MHDNFYFSNPPTHQDLVVMDSLKNVPQSVKFVQPIINRALELEKAEPIISYYCRLHAVQDIIAKGIHLHDNDAATFAGILLDDIENIKKNDPIVSSEEGISIISDDVTGQAYVDNFASKVFTKADREVRDKRTTKATSSTFMAAATFLDLLRLFGDLDPEVAQKIKYAKFHASRIMKAYKGGTDPNDYEVEQQLSSDDLNLQDETEAIPKSEIDQVISEVTNNNEDTTDNGDIGSHEQSDSEMSQLHENELPHAPSIPVLPSAPPIMPSAPESLPGRTSDFPKPPSDDVSFPDTPKGFTDLKSPSHSASLSADKPLTPSFQPKVLQSSKSLSPPPLTSRHPVSKDDINKIVSESEVIAASQKHAKFAISALNYDDKDTAIDELKKALELLTT